MGTSAKTEDVEGQLNATAFHMYVYLVKAGKHCGPREVMRGAKLTNPSVAYRNLQKLVDLGLVLKDKYGNYMAKEKVGLKGHVWIGKIIVPSFVLFGFIFLGNTNHGSGNTDSSFVFWNIH